MPVAEVMLKGRILTVGQAWRSGTGPWWAQGWNMEGGGYPGTMRGTDPHGSEDRLCGWWMPELQLLAEVARVFSHEAAVALAEGHRGGS